MSHHPQKQNPSGRLGRVLRSLGPGMPIVVAVAVSLFTPLDMVWGVVIGIVLAAFFGARLRRYGTVK